MRTKKLRIPAFALALVLALSLTACGSKENPAPDTTQAIYRAEFAQQLSTMRAEYGAPKGSFSNQKGVLFADLLDWDKDGTPELLTIVHEGVDEEDTFRFAVWGAADVAAVPLLDSVIGSSYGFLGSDLCVYVTRTDDGSLALCVDDSAEFVELKETYSTFSAGTVHSTVLSAQSSVGGWDEENDPVDPDAYQIDGVSCDKETFDARRSALGRDDCISILCLHIYDTAALDAFLTGQSETYSGGALEQATRFMYEPSQWLQDVLFTVGS